jgi:hypothetical protein
VAAIHRMTACLTRHWTSVMAFPVFRSHHRRLRSSVTTPGCTIERPVPLGNGRGFSVAEVVQTTEKVTGRPVRTQMCPRRAGNPHVLVSDSSEAREPLGWTLNHPDLESADRACMDMVSRQDAECVNERQDDQRTLTPQQFASRSASFSLLRSWHARGALTTRV